MCESREEGWFYVVQGLVATGCILTAVPCGPLLQLIQATVCAGDQSYVDQFVPVWVGWHPGYEVADEVGYGDGKTTRQADVIVD